MKTEFYRCAWCGQATNKDGRPLTMSQPSLTADVKKWDEAKLVNGVCCEKNPVAIGHAAIFEDIASESLKDLRCLSTKMSPHLKPLF